MKKFGFDNSDRYQIIEGADIKDENICKKSLTDIDEVIHLAANTGVNQSMEDPISDLQNNILGTLNLLKYSNYCNVKTFYSWPPLEHQSEQETPPFNELKLPKPISPYIWSK